MITRQLGQHDLSVPVIGIGSWQTFDVAAHDQHRVDDVLSAAIDAGVRLVDTSPMYGRAEEAIGRAMNVLQVRPQIATKIWANDANQGRCQFERQVDLFGTPIAIEQIHNLRAWEQQLGWLEVERAAGTVQLVGVTHYQSAAFDRLASAMRTGRVDVVQVPYNPLEREVERTILPLAADLGIGVVVMRPFAERELLRSVDPDALTALGVETWPQALLKWILADERVSVVIPATSSAAHVRSNARAGMPPFLDAEQRRLVERLVNA